jgi:hypothetical protein
MLTDSINHSRFAPFSCLALVFTTFACNQPPPPESDELTGIGTSPDGGTTDAMSDTGVADTADDDGTSTTEHGSGGDSDSGGDSGSSGDSGSGGDGDGDMEANPLEDSLYPLADGAQWHYLVKTTGGQILGMDITQANEFVWEGKQAFELVDEPDDDGEWNSSVIVRDGDLVLRVHREEMDNFGTTAIIDYDPGFIRVSEAWTMVGAPQEFLYDRTAYDGEGQNPVVEARGHTFEVLAVDEEITVPAGTFNCIKVERVRTLGAEAGALAWFWYAPGIGKIREERPLEMEVEELVSVSIPGVIDLP